MATQATAQFWVRTDGSDSNGGGFDASLTGAGTNYADSPTPIITLTGLSCALNATTLTQSGATFTAAMVGNAIQITGGTNFLLDIYWIVGFTDSNNVVLDRTPCTAGAGSAGTGNVGGALLTLKCLSNNGGSGLPSNPLHSLAVLVPGNTINLRGTGSLDGSNASPDYDWSAGYWTFPNASLSVGMMHLIGYNGRPLIKTCGLLAYNSGGWYIEHLKLIHSPGESYTTYGIFQTGVSGYDNIIDMNGVDGHGITVAGSNGGGGVFINNEIRNSGSTTVGSAANFGIFCVSYPTTVVGNYIHALRGTGIGVGSSAMGAFVQNVIVNNGGAGISIGASTYGFGIIGNTIDGNGSDGIVLSNVAIESATGIHGNLITNNGGYGLNLTNGTTTSNALLMRPTMANYNNYFNNTSGAYHNTTAGPSDLALDPQYTNRTGGDYSIGVNLKAKSFPGAFPGSSTTSYLDTGAVQRQEPTGGAGGIKRPVGMTGGMSA